MQNNTRGLIFAFLFIIAGTYAIMRFLSFVSSGSTVFRPGIKENLNDSISETTPETTESTKTEMQEQAVIPVEGITLPEGFKIHYFAQDIENARSLAKVNDNLIFVGSRTAGKVYAVEDTDGNRQSDAVYTIIDSLNQPNGVAYKDGDLYVAEINRVLKFSSIVESYKNKPDYEVIYDEYPDNELHGWKFISFGPDGKLYIPVGAPCNICIAEDPRFASITRINTDGSGFEIVAGGIRNTVGFDWDSETNDMWFTDNGRDWLGDNAPPDELNKITGTNQDFGFPYCHGNAIKDPEYGGTTDCSIYKPPEIELGAHVAALGIEFYDGDSLSRWHLKINFL